MFTLIRHALSMRRSQSVATFLAVALSVAAVFSLALSFMGVQSGLQRSSQRLGADIVVIPADAGVSVDSTELLFTGAPVNMYMDAQLADTIAAIPGVTRASAQFYGQTLNASCCSSAAATRLIGFSAADDAVIAPWCDADLSQGLAENQIIAGCDVAADFESGGKVLGHNVELVDRLDATGTDLDGSILMDIDAVRAMVSDTEELQYLWDEYGDPAGLISCVLVSVADGQRDSVISEISQIPGVAAIEAGGAVQKVSEQLGALFAIMASAALLLVLATLFQLFARFFSLAWDRRAELALFRAVGASKREVSRLILGEVGVLVGAGVVVGLLFGALLYLAVPSLLANYGSFPYIAPSLGVCLLAALAIAAVYGLVGLVSVAWPLSRIDRIDPSSAMQTGDID